MGSIVVHEFISLDGVYENPGWTAEFGFTEALGAAIGRMTTGSTAILLGRNTFDMFGPAWSERTAEDDPGAPFFNDTAKFVVSTSSASVNGWANSRLLGPYDADAIRSLKSDHEKIYVSGSGTLVRALIADGLVDELHLLVYPIVLGSGARLFAADGVQTRLRLSETESFDNGVVHLTYGPH
ncbi:dihydrofolate reductase family protein [Williamsia sterculiae]|uniref:Dihydrofolate reductase n=1 Tax=Williamsia sterculiae TaxID=1344003 RepID=A0A1N7EPG5_9NOCA|nr:dihydrofolate reductase family protein [Williamsia sterculiae]SIR89942.1 Dihydrofolate reductase [Williamsia sterculiae]